MAPEQALGPVGSRAQPGSRPPGPQPAGRLEAILARQGYRLVGGVDEVGRGALAGPLVAAAVLFDSAAVPEGLCDSKLLTPAARAACVDGICAAALAVSFAVADAEEIDERGLQAANRGALERAMRGLRPVPEYVISDHLAGGELCELPSVSLPRADGLSAAVAAASILAKVSRDELMERLDAEHPGYAFARHKGYGTDEHWAALRALGASPVHRRSFRGVGSYQPSVLAE